MLAWRATPPVIRALAGQALAFALLLLLSFALRGRSAAFWILLQGVLAAAFAACWGLGLGWRLFQLGLPCALAWQSGHPAPVWLYPALLLGLVLIYGGGVLTRVPLYLSRRGAWEALLEHIPEGEGVRVADLGAGLGGPLGFLSKRCPRADFLGVEASPLVWLVAWARTLGRKNCRMRLGSLWHQDLAGFQVVFAFLSPAPMPRLWEKVRREMAPGALLVSHTFGIPGVQPERVLPLPGRRDACLLVYRVGASQNQEP